MSKTESPPEKSQPNHNGASEPVAEAAAGNAASEFQAKLDAAEKKYVYLYAEFENFKKRVAKEREETAKFGWEPVAADLLEVLDNFERALKSLPPGTDRALATGLEFVEKQFRQALEKRGVQAVESLGKPFNPELHLAVETVPSDKAAGTVIQEQVRGFLLHGRLLRPARVSVSAGSTVNDATTKAAD